MAKTAQAQFIAMFNADNTGLAQALVEADVTFGAVAEYDPADEADTRNSKVTLTAVAESTHFTGEKEFHFTRLAASIVGAKAVTDDQADWDTDAEVLAFLNADVITAGKTDDAFALSELDIVRTDGADDAKVITVTIKAGHLKFLPGDVAVYTITQEITKTDLSTTNGELNGFTA
ncbi:hypothetical protein STRATTON_176 [Erwinia phage vB_EamM_Stratton]|uniref:Uncharacterized protein n=1 Tax=Erwinia phage vB_EamM_Stratton TaxID=1883378 RepID=A0A1B2IH52_9CAUD|nr:hypothetical protein STRATTON_176 [Erwinia phage vB_EamM_Stratton]